MSVVANKFSLLQLTSTQQQNRDDQMHTVELSDLESKIDSLLETLNRLKIDNSILRRQLQISTHMQSQLQQKNKAAAMKLRHIISQVKIKEA